MSYSICYAMQAFCYPFPALLNDAKAWFEQHGGEINDHFYRDFEVLKLVFEWWLFSRIMRQFPETPSVVPMVNINW